MADIDSGSGPPAPRKRADARRNEETLLDAAAAAFVTSGVDVPVRDIAAKAGVGVGTIYRHFPTRADLIVAVYRHQVEACAEAGPALLANSSTPHAALTQWIDLFVDFLVTKHGLAEALQSDNAAFETLHAYFLDRLVPVCAQLLDAAAAAGEIRPGTDAYELMLASAISVSARTATPATTHAAWPDSSSPDCASAREKSAASSSREGGTRGQPHDQRWTPLLMPLTRRLAVPSACYRRRCSSSTGPCLSNARTIRSPRTDGTDGIRPRQPSESARPERQTQ